MGSAAYYWARAAGALSRLTQYVVSTRAFFWHYVMADDLDVEAAEPDFRAPLFVVFAVAAVVGIPIAKGLGEAGIANTAAVQEGFGRLSFIAWMLEYERPFLLAIYRFWAVEERDVVRPLPACVLLHLRFLEHTLTQRCHIDCASRPLP